MSDKKNKNVESNDVNLDSSKEISETLDDNLTKDNKDDNVDNNYIKKHIFDKKCFEIEKLTTTLEKIGSELNKKNIENKDLYERISNLDKKNKSIVFKDIFEHIAAIKDGIDSGLDCFNNILNKIKTNSEKNTYVSELEGVKSGFEIVDHLFNGFFRKFDIEKININIPAKYDSDLHYAVTSVENSEYEDNTVVDVIKPGYINKIDKSVMRHAFVIISKKPATKFIDDDKKEHKD